MPSLTREDALRMSAAEAVQLLALLGPACPPLESVGLVWALCDVKALVGVDEAPETVVHEVAIARLCSMIAPNMSSHELLDFDVAWADHLAVSPA